MCKCKCSVVDEKKIKRTTEYRTYYQWLQTQSVTFQNSAIGYIKSELLRNNDLERLELMDSYRHRT